MKYLKMIFPKIGIITNGAYDFIGIIWFGRMYGKCIKTNYANIIEVGEYKNLPEYYLKSDLKPQFYLKKK